jgi:N-acetylglucosamine kinase-like BadF-type ATPase
MIIIVESGATKTDWLAFDEEGTRVNVKTGGMNLASMPEDVVRGVVEDAAAGFKEKGISLFEWIHFYAAGLICQSSESVPSMAINLDKVLRSLFPGALIEYASDTLAAARAVCGHKPGIAAILGTGSNSCLYDGERIVRNVRSGGFILGDEGGAARLGKLFISDFIKGLVPEPVSGEFSRDFEVDYMTVVKNVYKGEAPAGYLGSFAPWITSRYDSCDYIKMLVDNNFRDFFERALKQYDTESLPVGVVGGFGYANRDILRRLAGSYGIIFSKIIKAPVEGLVDFHSGRV